MRAAAVFCGAAAAAADVKVITIAANVTEGRQSPYLRGAGIEDVNHELYGGIYSQLIFGEDFEEPAGPDGVSGSQDRPLRGMQGATWTGMASPGASAEYTFSDDAYNGEHSQGVRLSAGGGAWVVNRGLGQQGVALAAGKDYEASVFAKNAAGTPATVAFALIVGGDVVANATAVVPAGAGWARYSFAGVTPPRGASCGATASPRSPCKRTPELGGSCVECDGAVAFGVVGAPAAVLLDHAAAHPGEWGRWRGLPVRRDIADGLVSGMGFTALRLGGTMCNAGGYRWKNFRGPRGRRPPYAGHWYRYASGGWRIFEFLDFCEAAGMKCVVTVNNNEVPADMADLVEYAYGNSSTAYGAMRIADGQHPQPYQPFVVEVGNEQFLTAAFVGEVREITTAMETRRRELGLGATLEYAIGHNFKALDLGSQLTKDMVAAVAPLGARAMWDFHLGGDDPGTAASEDGLLRRFRALLRAAGSRMRAAVFEENGRRHDLRRALGHARRNNRYARLGEWFAVDTSANCLQALSRNDNGWDQGQLFYLPNMTWLAPLGWSQAMISAASEPNVLAVADDAAWNATLDVAALQSDDRARTVVRVVNFGGAAVSAAVRLAGWASLPCGAARGVAAAASELYDAASDPAAVNAPGRALSVSPRPAAAAVGAGGVVPYTFRAYSFTVITVTCA